MADFKRHCSRMGDAIGVRRLQRWFLVARNGCTEGGIAESPIENGLDKAMLTFSRSLRASKKSTCNNQGSDSSAESPDMPTNFSDAFSKFEQSIQSARKKIIWRLLGGSPFSENSESLTARLPDQLELSTWYGTYSAFVNLARQVEAPACGLP